MTIFPGLCSSSTATAAAAASRLPMMRASPSPFLLLLVAAVGCLLSSLVGAVPKLARVENDLHLDAALRVPYSIFVVDTPSSKMSQTVLDEITRWTEKCRPAKFAVFSADPSQILRFRSMLEGDHRARSEVVAYGSNPKQYIYPGAGTIFFLKDGQIVGSQHGLLITMRDRIESVIRDIFSGLYLPVDPICGGAEVQSADPTQASPAHDEL